MDFLTSTAFFIVYATAIGVVYVLPFWIMWRIFRFFVRMAVR